MLLLKERREKISEEVQCSNCLQSAVWKVMPERDTRAILTSHIAFFEIKYGLD